MSRHPTAPDPPVLYLGPPTIKLQKACIDNTRTHVLSVIDSWLTSSDPASPKVLSLVDISGSGKSTVAQHVAWNAIRYGRLLCSFFFRTDVAAQSNTSAVVSSLARDLARLGGTIAADIANASRVVQDASCLESFHAQITTPLVNNPPDQPALILIDALDESGPPSDRAEFLAALAHEIPLLPPTAKVMITSKPEQDINDTFDTLGNSDSRDVEVYPLTFDVLGGENKRDLKTYITYAFERIAQQQRAEGRILPSIWPSNQQLKSLANCAKGLFIWAKTAAQYVSYSTDPQRALDELLLIKSRAAPEAAIDALYKHILHTAESIPGFDPHAYHGAMKLILTSPNPMTVIHINRTLGQDTSPTIACMRSVLEVQPDGVRIAHKSFREYIRDSQKCDYRFLISDGRPAPSAPTPPESPQFPLRSEWSSDGGNLYRGFPFHCLASAFKYPEAAHAAPDVSGFIEPGSISPVAIARGNFGDIWRAKYTDGRDIAIKSLRIYEGADQRRLERDSVKEMRIWSDLKHPNVLRLLGVCVFDGEFAMVTELMPNGNVTSYVAKNPGADRLRLLIEIAEGLSYLHRKGVVHGDLKGGNIVVSAEGTCMLIDFGLAKLTERSLGMSVTSSASGTGRWMAYELVNPEEGLGAVSTYSSDVYALGMTMLEILTCRVPFMEYINEPQQIAAVLKGQLPKRPSVESAPQLSDRMWELMNECWQHDPKLRPSASQVLERLELIRDDELREGHM